jgi:hypothetical protein
MSEDRRVLHIVRAGSPPGGVGDDPGDTVFVLGSASPEELTIEAERLLDLILEHDSVVTW